MYGHGILTQALQSQPTTLRLNVGGCSLQAEPGDYNQLCANFPTINLVCFVLWYNYMPHKIIGYQFRSAPTANHPINKVGVKYCLSRRKHREDSHLSCQHLSPPPRQGMIRALTLWSLSITHVETGVPLAHGNLQACQ